MVHEIFPLLVIPIAHFKLQAGKGGFIGAFKLFLQV